MRRFRELNDERGSMLLEVIISAALVAVMVIAVFTTFDYANRGSGEQKARAIAASLAQADQDRMRVLPAADLAKTAGLGPQAQAGKTVGGTTFTITSQTDWLADPSQSTTCTAGASSDYLRIVSTVSPPAKVGIKPVTLTSVVTPPVGSFGANQGSLAISVQKATVTSQPAVGQPGIPVTITGPGGTIARTTDSAGCAFFANQTIGDYSATISMPGYVDVDGNTIVSKAYKIASETMTTGTVLYDVADTVNVTFDTQTVNTSGVLQATLQSTTAPYVRFYNSGLTAGTRQFGTAAPASTIPATNLFPFTTPYSVYAGNCDGALPAGPASILATATGPTGVVVRVPTVVFQVQSGGKNVTLPTVKVTATGSGCSGTSTIAGGGPVNGRVWDDLPYGTYSYCATNGTRLQKGTLNNSNAGGQTVTVPDLTAAGSSLVTITNKC
ncbi:MAG: hypothetical protein QOH72_1846 [Solirubrobacteraceae bacterium]|nr:hypothetical protein [Solirubrobacteraceae bacterium]